MEVVAFVGFASFVCGGTFAAGYLLAEHFIRKLLDRS